jgi:molybdate-binding protein/DNA-binding transcriptional regulator YhcF (GntR family)
MDETPLYQQIAESVRQEILYGTLKPGDQVPPVREMAQRWDCTPGTVQRAYKELAWQGLVIGRAGRGTRVISALPAQEATPLRRAALVHQAESFLLETLNAGHTPEEIEGALRLALDRWRALRRQPEQPLRQTVRFAGSHDPAVAMIASRFGDIAPEYTLRVSFTGSLGGLIALAENQADVAGSHLWDEESDTYNVPFVRRLLPGRRVALLTLTHRRLGLILPPGNPAGVEGLEDLAGSGLRFANRQPGAGTRVWLDAQLNRRRIDAGAIAGYGDELPTHSEVARAVAEEEADVGLGVETAAMTFGLSFVPLQRERYDLVVPADSWERAPIENLRSWLGTPAARAAIGELGGYDTAATGCVSWVE